MRNNLFPKSVAKIQLFSYICKFISIFCPVHRYKMKSLLTNLLLQVAELLQLEKKILIF